MAQSKAAMALATAPCGPALKAVARSRVAALQLRRERLHHRSRADVSDGDAHQCCIRLKEHGQIGHAHDAVRLDVTDGMSERVLVDDGANASDTQLSLLVFGYDRPAAATSRARRAESPP